MKRSLSSPWVVAVSAVGLIVGSVLAGMLLSLAIHGWGQGGHDGRPSVWH